MAAVAPSCHLAKMASERAKLCVSGPQILPKSGPGIVAGKWARNRDRTPGCCLKIKQSPVSGHETVARKWAQNPDRIFRTKHTQNHHKLSLGRASRPVQDRSLQAVSLMPRNTLTTQMGQA